MRWYISRDGKTDGPLDEDDIVIMIKAGMKEAMVRDEAGGQWTPLHASPFSKFVKKRRTPGQRAASAAVVALLCLVGGTLVVGLPGGIAAALAGAGLAMIASHFTG